MWASLSASSAESIETRLMTDLCVMELVDLLRLSGRFWTLRVLLRRNISGLKKGEKC